LFKVKRNPFNKMNLLASFSTTRLQNRLFKLENFVIMLISIFFLAGFFFHQMDLTRKLVMSITDIFLFLANGVVIYFLFKKHFSGKILVWSFLVFISTFFIEYIGVITGVIFGGYHYGETMLFQIGNVPVIIAVNWTILILATYSIALRITSSPVLSPILSSVFIVIFDIILEPVAMHLDYWQWEMNTVPIRNYIAWFTISLVSASFLSVLKINPDSKILRGFFFIQLGFFLLFWMVIF
jgi:uncharacterized membrane protein